jgi:hypothetical protein
MSQNVQSCLPAPLSAPAPSVRPTEPVGATGLGSGTLAGLLAALVTGTVYGLLLHLHPKLGSEAVLTVGLLVGLAAGRYGARHPVVPAAGALLSLAAIYLGQVLSLLLIAADLRGHGLHEAFDAFGPKGLHTLWVSVTSPQKLAFLEICVLPALAAALTVPAAGRAARRPVTD